MLLLQEFDVEIRDKKGKENSVADHLFCLVHDCSRDSISFHDSFPDEQLFALSHFTPWFAHIVNFLVTGQFPPHWEKREKDRFRAQA